MRWIWIDKFTDFDSGKRAVAVKTVTLAEDQIHDLYPDFPVFPHSLIVEAMAQTAGMLVGEAEQFKWKVVLAKVNRATFHRMVRPGQVMQFIATVEQLNETGASISGKVTIEPGGLDVAEIELMFSHLENNLSGQRFPEHNFVFTESFLDLLRNYRRGLSLPV
jgi:3-hydroxyacyl-[acyl-carrier-protein] dehydratase